MNHDELQNNSSDTGTKVPMTHDELLERIKRYGDWAEVAFDTSPTNALRAVVELHKPRVNLDLPYQPVCQECANILDPWGENTYPCSTIQAIEKELK